MPVPPVPTEETAAAPRLGWGLEGLLAHLPLSLLFTWPLVLNLGGNGLAPGVMTEDRAQNLWNLWWVKTALLDQHTNPFIATTIWYPTPVSLYYHTLNIFNGLVSLPFQGFMSLPAILSGIVFFSFVLAGWGAYLLVAYVLGRTGLPPSGRRVGALVGSAAFTYSAYHLATQRGQLQLVSLEWVPFYVLFLLRAVHDWPLPREGRAWLRWVVQAVGPAAFFLFLIALVDWYYVMYMVLFTLLYGLYVVGRAWATGERSRAAVGRALAPLLLLVAIGGLFLALVAWQLVPMAEELRTASYMRPVPGIAFINSADLFAFFLPPLDHHWWGLGTQQIRWEWPVGVQRYEVYFGYLTLALAALGVLAWRGKPTSPTAPGVVAPVAGRLPLPGRTFWLGAILVFFALALGPVLQVGGVPQPGVPMPYTILERIPGFNISRSPDRFDMPLTLCLGVLAGGGAAALAGRVGGMFVELWPAPYAQPPAAVPAYYQELGRDPADYAILELPPQDDYWHGAFAMYYQTAHHKRIFGGYISREYAHPFMESTAGFRDFFAGAAGTDMFVDSQAARLTALAQYQARLIVLYKKNVSRPTKVLPVDLPRYRALIATVLGQAQPTPIHVDDEVEVYAVPPPAASAPYLVLGDNWYKAETPDGHRWLRHGDGTLQIVSPQAGSGVLEVEAASFHRPRTLEVLAGDQIVTTVSVGPEIATYRLGPFPLAAGVTTLRLRTADAPETPTSLGVSTSDDRPLTLMFRQVRLASP